FSGRKDSQLKVRGIRAEAGEIEQVLRGYPGITDALVTSSTRDPDALVAYLSMAHHHQLHVPALLEFLRERLPAPLIPRPIMLDSIPRTDRGKFAIIEPASLPGSGDSKAGRWHSPIEEVLAAIWRDLLRVENIDPDDNFFDLGGHSMLAVQFSNRVRSVFG